MASSGIDAGCYVYKPNTTRADHRPKAHNEPHLVSKARLDAFHNAWKPVEEGLHEVLTVADAGAVEQVCTFLASTDPRNLDRIPTGLITTTTAGSLYAKVKAEAQKDILVISVPAGQCTNLKSVLRCIASSVSVKSETRLLNYDLDALKIYMDAEQYEKVVLYFGNGESLHGGVLSDLVDVLDSYKTRIPLVLMLETAVSIDLFQEKLTQRARGQLRGTAFSTASASEVVEKVFESLVTDEEHQLMLGPNLATMLMTRQDEHMQSALAFVQEIKYMYMLHFYRNPLSMALCQSPAISIGLEALHSARQSKSFKAHIEQVKSEKSSKIATQLMKDDEALRALLLERMAEGRKQIRQLLSAARTLKLTHDHTTQKGALPWSRLYEQTMSAQLSQATLPSMRDALLAAPSNLLTNLLEDIKHLNVDLYKPLLDELLNLVNKYGVEQGPLRTEHDPSHETTKTTVKGKRIALSKQRAALSKGDEEYTTFVAKVEQLMMGLVEEHLIDPKANLFHEIYLFDSRVPIREAFAPRPRYVVEHALTVPGAYLACECCDPDQRVLSAHQPATAVLYQLYLESGTIVNIADLWSAFDAIIISENIAGAGESEAHEESKLALFYRALAELRYLGMIKSSRKRADHLVKMKFIGL